MIINSSLIKALYFKGNERPSCPHYIYNIYINKNYESEPSESMNFGSYFETLCIGSGARGRITDDLPRKQLTEKQNIANRVSVSKGNPVIYYGEKTINQIRIEAQASEFKRLCAKYKITIVPPFNTQVKIYKRFSENTILSGELDVFPTLMLGESDPRLSIIDLKLTADLGSTFGEFAWGDFDSMDKLQGWMYHYLVRDIDLDLIFSFNENCLLPEIITPAVTNIINNNDLLFFFWVFDYKKDVSKLGNKFFKVDYDKNTESELTETIRKTESLLDYFELHNWSKNPCKTCEKCPIPCEHNPNNNEKL